MIVRDVPVSAQALLERAQSDGSGESDASVT
jgi:hypothetical protein